MLKVEIYAKSGLIAFNCPNCGALNAHYANDRPYAARVCIWCKTLLPKTANMLAKKKFASYYKIHWHRNKITEGDNASHM
jgi:hypothetical protein